MPTAISVRGNFYICWKLHSLQEVEDKDAGSIRLAASGVDALHRREIGQAWLDLIGGKKLTNQNELPLITIRKKRVLLRVSSVKLNVFQ